MWVLEISLEKWPQNMYIKSFYLVHNTFQWSFMMFSFFFFKELSNLKLCDVLIIFSKSIQAHYGWIRIWVHTLCEGSRSSLCITASPKQNAFDHKTKWLLCWLFYLQISSFPTYKSLKYSLKELILSFSD